MKTIAAIILTIVSLSAHAYGWRLVQAAQLGAGRWLCVYEKQTPQGPLRFSQEQAGSYCSAEPK